MTNQRFSILLIFMMVITPVASAFSHCPGMAMPSDLSESNISSVAGLADDAATSNHHDSKQENYHNQGDKQCHASGSCTFHVCGSCAITLSSTSTNAFIASFNHQKFEPASLESTPFLPEIRPPISIL